MMEDLAFPLGVALIILASAFACRECTRSDAYVICIRSHSVADCKDAAP